MGGPCAKWNKLEKDNSVWSQFYVESEKAEFMEKESRMLIARVWVKRREWGDVG